MNKKYHHLQRIKKMFSRYKLCISDKRFFLTNEELKK